jgi:hypothetical protein
MCAQSWAHSLHVSTSWPHNTTAGAADNHSSSNFYVECCHHGLRTDAITAAAPSFAPSLLSTVQSIAAASTTIAHRCCLRIAQDIVPA